MHIILGFYIQHYFLNVFIILYIKFIFYRFVVFQQQQQKAMETHSSTLTWKIPWMEEPGGLQSMRSLGVGHDWATSLSLFTLMHWRRKWQPTPVFLPGESQGRGSLVGCRLWGHTESDMTDMTAAAAWFGMLQMYIHSSVDINLYCFLLL